MRIVPTGVETTVEAESSASVHSSISANAESLVSHKSYHEMSDKTLHECDALEQLTSNIALLSDMQSRLSFMMREIRYLMKF